MGLAKVPLSAIFVSTRNKKGTIAGGDKTGQSSSSTITRWPLAIKNNAWGLFNYLLNFLLNL
jgi:hypothetical protein